MSIAAYLDMAENSAPATSQEEASFTHMVMIRQNSAPSEDTALNAGYNQTELYSF